MGALPHSCGTFVLVVVGLLGGGLLMEHKNKTFFDQVFPQPLKCSTYSYDSHARASCTSMPKPYVVLRTPVAGLSFLRTCSAVQICRSAAQCSEPASHHRVSPSSRQEGWFHHNARACPCPAQVFEQVQVQTSAGPVDLPILYFDGGLVGAFYLVDPELAQAQLAVDETVILLHLPLPLVGVSIVMECERQQNDSLVNG